MGQIYTLPVITGITEDITGFSRWDSQTPTQSQINVCNTVKSNGLYVGSVRFNLGVAYQYFAAGENDDLLYAAPFAYRPNSSNYTIDLIMAVRPNARWYHVVYVGTTEYVLETSRMSMTDSGIFETGGTYYLGSPGDLPLSYYSSREEALDAISPYIISGYQIVYRDTNCTHSGPDEAIVGDTVTVNYTFPDGYGIVNPSSDIYVTNNGVVIPSQYSNGVLTFRMPDPS